MYNRNIKIIPLININQNENEKCYNFTVRDIPSLPQFISHTHTHAHTHTHTHTTESVLFRSILPLRPCGLSQRSERACACCDVQSPSVSSTVHEWLCQSRLREEKRQHAIHHLHKAMVPELLVLHCTDAAQQADTTLCLLLHDLRPFTLTGRSKVRGHAITKQMLEGKASHRSTTYGCKL